MGAEDRFAAAQRRLDAIETEQQDRRALRSRQIEATRTQAQDNFNRQSALAQKTVERLQEMGKRQKRAGGWGTDSALRDKPQHYNFADQDAGPAQAERPPQHPTRLPQPHSLSGAALFADNAPGKPPAAQHEGWPSDQPAAAPAAPPVRPSRRRPVRDDDLDEDDYTNHRWMR